MIKSVQSSVIQSKAQLTARAVAENHICIARLEEKILACCISVMVNVRALAALKFPRLSAIMHAT